MTFDLRTIQVLNEQNDPNAYQLSGRSPVNCRRMRGWMGRLTFSGKEERAA